jgi:hypothetical protein
MKKLGAYLLLSTVGVVGWIFNAGAQVRVVPGQAKLIRPVPRTGGGVVGVCIPTIYKLPTPTGETGIHWSIQPTMDLDTLSYAIELPAGATLIQGSLAGTAASRVGATTRGTVTIDLGTGSGFRECVLTATGSFLVDGPTGPMPETVFDDASVFWGVPTAPLPVVRTPLPGGGTQNVAVVPSTTR